MSRGGLRGAAALLALLLPGRAPAADAAPPASLSSAVPSDAVFVLHARLDEAARKRMEPVWDALEASRCLEDLRSRLLASVKDEKHRKWLERDAPVWIGLVEKIAWRKLFAREFLVAARADDRRRQWVALFRVDPAEREGIVRPLERVLHAFGSASPELELIHSRRENDSVTALYKRTIEPLEDVGGVPPSILRALEAIVSDGRELAVAGKGDVILLATSGNLLQRSLQLLDGAGSDLGFAHTARRESRLAAAKLAAPDGPGFELHADPSALLPEVEALGALGAFTAAGKLEGASLAYGFHAALAGEARGDAGALRKALAETLPLGKVLDRIPGNATGFYAASWPRVGVLLDAVESAWKEVAPDAGGLIEDERTRRDLQELSPRGFVAQLPGSWFGYAEGSPGKEPSTQLLGFMLRALVGLPGQEPRSERTNSGVVLVELPGSRGYVGHVDGKLAASSSPGAKELVTAALEQETAAGSPAEVVKRLEVPPGDLVEAFDVDQPPRVLQLYLAGRALGFALKNTQADPALNALIEASRKLTSALEKARPPVARARGYTVREVDALRGRGSVTFRD